jgi:hypothetical protein
MPFIYFNANKNGKPAGVGVGPGMGGQLRWPATSDASP